MVYRTPVADIAHALRTMSGFGEALAGGLYEGLSDDLVDAVLHEAGKFATEEIAPLNRDGDRFGARMENGVVCTAPGWRETYGRWVEAGWNGLHAPEEHGGQGLPLALWAAATEMWNAASMAFGIGPVLTQGAVEAMEAHASDELKRLYLARLVSGSWTGVMALTEPQAGSDLAALRARAERAGDGTYRIFGQKIFITYGDHDLTDNIVHFVLARLPDAPAGTRGISLFLVPKFLVNGDGSLGPRNDMRCHALEHKLGIHASPTCTMIYGDHEGATGYLVGQEHRGLACMFTMMNSARLAVGLQGVAIAGRAYAQALDYAHDRKQGRAPGDTPGIMTPIVRHPDVRRMLMTMKGLTDAARAICYRTAVLLDHARRAPDAETRRRALEEASLWTPVAKAFSTDAGIEVSSLGVQVHGGMGYIEETGAAQHFRDARIAAIYEGTNGIQAIDLVTRKLPQSDGDCVRRVLAELRGATGARPVLDRAVAALEETTCWLLAPERTQYERLAGATPYLRLFGLAAGGCLLAKGATASGEIAHQAVADFFIQNLTPDCEALAETVMRGVPSLAHDGVDAALAL